MVVSVKVTGDPIRGFLATYVSRWGPEYDNLNVNIAQRLTRQAKKNLDDDIIRKEERGHRPRSRLTGTLTGHTGHSSAIQGEAIGRGGTTGEQGRGVGWPKIDVLDRRARHWRRLEFGTGPFEMPRGFILQGQKGSPVIPVRGAQVSSHVFMPTREYFRSVGLRRGTRGRTTVRQRAARKRIITPPSGITRGSRRTSYLTSGKARGITAKHFLQEAWDEVAGREGEKAFKEHVDVVRKVFGKYITAGG